MKQYIINFRRRPEGEIKTGTLSFKNMTGVDFGKQIKSAFKEKFGEGSVLETYTEKENSAKPIWK